MCVSTKLQTVGQTSMGKEAQQKMKQRTVGVSDLLVWEQGKMSAQDEAALFQRLVESGWAWKLKGKYARRASELIANGTVKKPE